MKRSISSLKSFKKLNKSEQQSIKGSRGPSSQSDLCIHLCKGVGTGQGYLIFETVCTCG